MAALSRKLTKPTVFATVASPRLNNRLSQASCNGLEFELLLHGEHFATHHIPGMRNSRSTGCRDTR